MVSGLSIITSARRSSSSSSSKLDHRPSSGSPTSSVWSSSIESGTTFSTLTPTSDELIHDILIIGAGPCGLALAVRLCEPFPSALFTKNEHRKFHILRSSSRRRSKPARTSRRWNTGTDRFISGPCITHQGLDVKILDANADSWMRSWNEKFEQLNIKYLRSPMFFHPDPRDRDGLLAFAYMNGREDELKEIQGVIGKELSKHHRKKKQKDGK